MDGLKPCKMCHQRISVSHVQFRSYGRLNITYNYTVISPHYDLTAKYWNICVVSQHFVFVFC